MPLTAGVLHRDARHSVCGREGWRAVKKYKNDIILVAVILLAAFLTGAYIYAARDTGAYALVTVDGDEIYRLPLDEDITIEVGGDGRYNTIVIENGSVRVEDASCPDHVCINQGQKMYGGETIICLPNRMVITVVSDNAPDIDAVVQ